MDNRIRIRANGSLVNDAQFRMMHPNTSFPLTLTTETLNDFGADPVLPGAQPSGEWWQSAVFDGVEEVGGQWFTKYLLAPVFTTQEEQDAYVAALEAANLKAQTPREISHRQFYQALWETDRITYEEADAAINLGTLPAAIDAFVQMMMADPATEKEGQRAKLALTGAKTFERDHYFVMVFAAMFGMTDLEIDELWRFAYTLV